MGLNLLAWAVIGYALGSLSSGVLVARLLGRPDPRLGGSRHTGATNTWRQAGRTAALATLLLDLGKGALSVWLAERYAWSAYGIAVVSAAAVVGHCWPIWLRGQGGMGLAPYAGALGIVAPPLPLVFIAGWAVALLATRHSPRAAAMSVALVPLIAAALAYSPPVLALVLASSLVVYLRHTADFSRQYRRAWLD